MERFSDFAEEEFPLEGDKVRIQDLLNRELVFTAYRIKASKYEKNTSGECLTMQFRTDDGPRVCFTGSDVLIAQFRKYGDRLPFVATIRQVDRYFTLS